MRFVFIGLPFSIVGRRGIVQGSEGEQIHRVIGSSGDRNGVREADALCTPLPHAASTLRHGQRSFRLWVLARGSITRRWT